MKRRLFLQSSAASLLLGLPGNAYASDPERKFIFVYNAGGWDPTRVFAPEFSNPQVDMETLSEVESAGNISFVSHPDRPSVSQFFQAYHSDLLVLNGIQVRSIAHDICTTLSLTGNASGVKPDWPSILAAEAKGDYALPHLVVGGPSFPGEFGAKVARSGLNGQLDGLLSGSIMQLRDDLGEATLQSSRSQRFILDEYVLSRSRSYQQAQVSGRAEVLGAALLRSHESAVALQDYNYLMDFQGGTADAGIDIAVDALRLGVSRCVTVSGSMGNWDSHANNDDIQSGQFEALFGTLRHLRTRLENTLGQTGAPLSHETVVVVLSEMGRTPRLNSTDGKDHWPYTSQLIWGPGITGDRVVGSFDDGYTGELMDLASGELNSNGSVLGVESVGAALLQAGDVDPGEYIQDAEPLSGILT